MRLLTLTSSLPLLVLSGFTSAQVCESNQTLVDQIGEATGQQIVVDPRVCNLDGVTVSDDTDYQGLLGILRANNLALEMGEMILILPASVNSTPTRLLQEDDSAVSDNEIVARVVQIPDEAAQSLAAPRLVAVLRPMMAQRAELSAVRDANTLIFVDRYDNIRRLTATVEEMIESANP